MSAPILSIFNALLKNRIDIINALASPPPPQRFIVGHLPEEHGVYGLLIGPDGSRKSWLVLHISLGVAGGRPIAIGPDGTYLWEAPERGRVVYLASEDSANVLIRRIWSIAQLPGYEWVRDADEFLDIVPTYSSLRFFLLIQTGDPSKRQSLTRSVNTRRAHGSSSLIPSQIFLISANQTTGRHGEPWPFCVNYRESPGRACWGSTIRTKSA